MRSGALTGAASTALAATPEWWGAVAAQRLRQPQHRPQARCCHGLAARSQARLLLAGSSAPRGEALSWPSGIHRRGFYCAARSARMVGRCRGPTAAPATAPTGEGLASRSQARLLLAARSAPKGEALSRPSGCTSHSTAMVLPGPAARSHARLYGCTDNGNSKRGAAKACGALVVAAK